MPGCGPLAWGCRYKCILREDDQKREAETLSLTDYQSKYIAHELTRRFLPDSVEKLTAALADAQVDLNPHQIDAALFAFKSPLSKIALLADEVGLGKTIEAGLVLSQKWAERKRRILVITPSNLRKQWYQELTQIFVLKWGIRWSWDSRSTMRIIDPHLLGKAMNNLEIESLRKAPCKLIGSWPPRTARLIAAN
jgi:SNF2 family DNA or RNA helicase